LVGCSGLLVGCSGGSGGGASLDSAEQAHLQKLREIGDKVG
jgi:hypothetical protein